MSIRFVRFDLNDSRASRLAFFCTKYADAIPSTMILGFADGCKYVSIRLLSDSSTIGFQMKRASKLSMLLVYEIFVRFESNICDGSFGEDDDEVVVVVVVFAFESLLFDSSELPFNS